MAKNKKFKKRYVISVEGVTTNGFAEDYLDDILKVIVEVMNQQFKQVKVELRDYNEEFVDKSKN